MELLLNKVCGQPAALPVAVRRCGPADAAAFYALQNEVRAAMPHPEQFVPDTQENITAYLAHDLCLGVFDILEQECSQQISSNVAHLKASCGDESIRAAMRLAPGEAMLLLDEICFNRLCHPVMRSLSYYTNFFDFSILRKLL